jgi:hypothetical protein
MGPITLAGDAKSSSVASSGNPFLEYVLYMIFNVIVF